MSETDDTDVLLLIPPDFFAVRSSEDSSCLETARTVVPRAHQSRRSIAALHSTIGYLEHRVSSLERTVTPRKKHSSFTSDRTTPSCERLYSGERRSYTFPRRKRRKNFMRKSDFESSIVSTTYSSSFCEDIPVLALSETAPCYVDIEKRVVRRLKMDSELSSIASSSTKQNDQFMLNEIDEFLNRVDSYEVNGSSHKVPEELNLKKDCYKLQKFESQSKEVTLPSGRKIPKDFLDTYIYLAKNNEPLNCNQNENSKAAHSEETTPTKILTSKDPKSSVRKLNFNEKDITSTPKPLTRVNTVPSIQKQSKVHDFASLSNCDTISNVSSYISPLKEQFRFRKYNSDRDIECVKNKNDLSKFPHSVDTDLLSLSELWNDRDVCKLDNAKLEEERLKREHCESVIQDLQKKILELQEKIAVAVRVDRAKDQAIARLKEAWVRITNTMEAADNKHRMAMEKSNEELMKLRQSAEDAQKKTRHFESELYKALDLAHDYQDKCKSAQKEKQHCEAEIEKILAEKAEILQKKEEELQNARENYESVMRLNKQLTDCIKNAEENLEKEKQSHNDTRAELSSANKLTQNYQEELTLLKQEKDLLRQKVKEEHSRVAIMERQLSETKSLEQEVKNLRRHLELQKEELKSYYQKQLEEAVMAKLSEFQEQLDTAEKEMEREANERENRVVDVFNRKIQGLEQQHKLEVQVLEEKQKEEIKLYRLQLAQTGEKITTLENKLERYRQRRADIASQLHSVMQGQWQQALSILTDHDSSRNTTESRLEQGCQPRASQCSGPSRLEPLNLSSITSDRRFNSDALSDTDIQHYVKMLLNKPPDGNNLSGDSGPVKCEQEEPTSDKSPEDRPRQTRRGNSKPPWKA